MTIEQLTEQYNGGNIMFALFDDTKPVGYASLRNKENGVYELKNVSVLPEYRHNGYGKKLIDYAKKTVKDIRGTKIVIGIIEENAVLKNWYISNGFVHTGTISFSHLPFTVGYLEMNTKE